MEPQLTAPLGPDIDSEMFKDVAKNFSGSVRMRRARQVARSVLSVVQTA
jgi:hypothetical protein